MLPPGEHLETDVVLTVPAGSAAGAVSGARRTRRDRATTRRRCRPLGARWSRTCASCRSVRRADDRRAATGQRAGARRASQPATAARLTVTVGTDAHADLAVEAHLISPWGTWEWIGPAASGAELPARGTVELGFDVAPPVWVEPGEWWALIRVGCAGRLLYSPAVKVTVR